MHLPQVVSAGRSGALVGALLMLNGCFLVDAPQSSVGELDERCKGTIAGNSCVNFEVTGEDEIQRDEPKKLAGTLHWAMYKKGDVGFFGPGDNAPVLDGLQENVDVASVPAAVVVPDVPAGSYQVLAYMDSNANGAPDKGEIVTFPSGPFTAPKDKRADVVVKLNYVK